MDKPTILIYRDHILASSETFIQSQADQMKEFDVCFFGSRKVKGLKLKQEILLINQVNNLTGKIKEGIFKLTGCSFGKYKRLKQKNIKLVHAHFAPNGVFALPVAKSLNVPLVVTFHGYDITTKEDKMESNFSNKLYLNRKKKLQDKGTLFIAVSQYIKEQMIEKGYPEDKIIQHYIGVDTDYFTKDPTIHRKPMVLFVGRLVENKGADYLIRAMSQVQKSMPEVKLVIVGDGPLRRKLEELAQSLLISYRFMGTQPKEVIRALLNEAKIFSVPSVTIENGNSEGFGMVFAEANAMGVPVVSFKTGGIPEAVAHGETGLLAEEKDKNCLAEYLKQLLKDNDLWEKFSKQGEERVRDRFNLKKQNKRLEDIYHSLL